MILKIDADFYLMISRLLFFAFFVASLFRVSAQPQLELFSVATGFSSPVSIANANDGSNRLFIVERGGQIKIINHIPTGTVLPLPFLNISGIIASGGESGLLGLVFHPQFPDTPYFFVNYTINETGQLKTKVVRYTVSADPNIADINSALQILEVDQPHDNHNAGDIKFGPDGYLYITMGDGGSGEDPDNYAQDTASLLGSLLRIDISGDDFPADPDANYMIPPTNPFVGFPGYREEFWSIGLRNPWRISFDRMTGDLWIADVGQVMREEVNFQQNGSAGGQNYGWSCKEGNQSPFFNPCIPGPLTDPIFDYVRADGRSITGGFVYRGNAFSNLKGYYVVADYATGNFWTINSTNFNDVTKFPLLSNIASFGESDSGELYAAKRNSGTIYRVFDSTACEDVVQISVHNDSLYLADSLINSDAPVTIGPAIQYFSPNIELSSPFSVAINANFEAQTISCFQQIITGQF